jgi:hypothetical protein
LKRSISCGRRLLGGVVAHLAKECEMFGGGLDVLAAGSNGRIRTDYRFMGL